MSTKVYRVGRNSGQVTLANSIELTFPSLFFKKNLRKQILAYIFASTYLRNMKARRDVYQAIADPTRRAIINMIASQPLNVNSIAEKFNVSRQAISLQIQILVNCGLIAVKQQGRDRLCEAKLDQLGEVSVWIEQYRQHWASKLDSLETYIEKIKKERNGNRNK